MHYKTMQNNFTDKLWNEMFFYNSMTYSAIYIITDHCDQNDQERHNDFSIYYLETMFPKDLDQKNLSYKLPHYQGFSIYGNTCNLITFLWF